MEPAVTTLEIGDDVVSSPTADDIERALQRPRDDEWYLCLTRPNDDSMDVFILADGSFQVECDANDQDLRAASAIDEALLKSLLLSFLAGDDSWSRQCQWVTPPANSPSTGPPKALIFAVIGLIVLVAGLALTRNKQWIAVLFALAFPGMIAGAMVMKMREVRRAATWTQANARILKSELSTVEEKIAGNKTRTVTLPIVEYEFTKGFDKIQGNRVSIGEIAPGSVEVQQALERYRVGASVPVYYNPANPRESVLDRELPRYFAVAWVFVAVLTVVLVGGALWVTGIISVP
jgi:hypothetical protein